MPNKLINFKAEQWQFLKIEFHNNRSICLVNDQLNNPNLSSILYWHFPFDILQLANMVIQ